MIVVFNFQIQSAGRMFDLWDVGGLERTRPLWRSYTRNTDLIFFVLDSADSERLDEAKLELQSVIKLTEKFSVPIIVIANKQDLPSAVPVEKISRQLGINKAGRSQPVSLKSSCGITGEGLEHVFQEVRQAVQKRRARKISENPKVTIGGKIHRSISQHFL